MKTLKTYEGYYWTEKKRWQPLGIVVRATDCYKAENKIIKKTTNSYRYNIIAMSKEMKILNDCIK